MYNQKHFLLTINLIVIFLLNQISQALNAMHIDHTVEDLTTELANSFRNHCNEPVAFLESLQKLYTILDLGASVLFLNDCLVSSKVSLYEIKDSSGMTLLHYACTKNYYHCVNIILHVAKRRQESKKVIFALDNKKNTPIHYAASNASTESIPFILERAVQCNFLFDLMILENINKKTAFTCAEENNKKNIIALFNKYKSN